MAYSKTSWENLPSTNTPINATNLNKIETELEIKDNLIVAGPTNLDETLGTTDIVNLNLGNIILQKGNDFVLENGNIKCLKSGTIYIDASLRFKGGNPSSFAQIGIVISKNNSEIYESRAPYESQYLDVKKSGYIEVSANDLITLGAVSNDANVGLFGWTATTSIAVKYV